MQTLQIAAESSKSLVPAVTDVSAVKSESNVQGVSNGPPSAGSVSERAQRVVPSSTASISRPWFHQLNLCLTSTSWDSETSCTLSLGWALLLRGRQAVMLASTQLRGYLATTAAEGLKFDVKENELPVLTVYTDASFAPDSEGSHGSFILLLGSSLIFWSSGRQGL